MWVAPHHLVRDQLDDVSEVEGAAIMRDLGVKYDLEEHITQLFRDSIVDARINRVDKFVALLEQVGPERSVGLLEVPRAALRPSEGRDDVGESLQRRGRALYKRKRRELLRSSRRRSKLIIVRAHFVSAAEGVVERRHTL
jgi:hypothetical protein